LIVEAKPISGGLRFNLEAEGHARGRSGDGASAVRVVGSGTIRRPGLDVMLPARALQCRAELRRENYVPILRLTAREDARESATRFCLRR